MTSERQYYFVVRDAGHRPWLVVRTDADELGLMPPWMVGCVLRVDERDVVDMVGRVSDLVRDLRIEGAGAVEAWPCGTAPTAPTANLPHGGEGWGIEAIDLAITARPVCRPVAMGVASSGRVGGGKV